MSNTEIFRIINKNLQEVRISNRSGSHLNCIRLNASCSDEHNLEIIKRCMEYLKNGIPFLTECIFVNGMRCDILLPATYPALIEEIAVSESNESLANKQKKYPFPIKVIRL